MKYLVTALCLLLSFYAGYAQPDTRKADTTVLDPVEVKATRAADKAPFAKTNISKAEIAKNNIGQDLPFLLNQTPSVVANSDAGNGIGYTGIRIRGSDASRINVTLNGIPYNDAESQGTFFVDLPDIASSVSSIQVQRGVGTSSNGAGAFGASINISTNELNEKKSLEFQSSAGSYHSFKNTLLLHSGLIGKHFTFDGRLSNIRSDGYIDRASSRLQSFYSSAAYTDNKQSLRLNIFSGKEKTYQSWYGIDEKTLANNRRYNSAGTEKVGEPYANETDNYTQTHYQLFYNRTISNHWKSNIAIFLTRGLGYYEQYKADESLNSYGLPDYINGPDTITSTNLVRQLWLDNYFYGTVFSFQYDKDKTNLILGGGLNQYDGKHYGKIVSADLQVAVPVNYRWYDLDAVKKDFSIYGKWTQKIHRRWQTFIDLQARLVDYRLNGFRNNPDIRVSTDYLFFNPKAGVTYTSGKNQFYFSYAMANKEPNRDDFETGLAQVPKPEQLHDFEAGFEYKKTDYSWGVNLYYMMYKNQLVLNGKINDVGAYTRINIPNSFRAGVELSAGARFNAWINARANLSFSRNRVKNFTEFIDDYDNGGQQTKIYKSADIAYSPSVVGAATINIIPFKHAEISLMSKYTGKQYLDNTSNNNRKLDPFYVQDIRLSYQLPIKKGRSVNFFVQGNNVFSEKYEPNGYTFSYIYGGTQTTENYYFPMATFNLMAGLGIRL